RAVDSGPTAFGRTAICRSVPQRCTIVAPSRHRSIGQTAALDRPTTPGLGRHVCRPFGRHVTRTAALRIHSVSPAPGWFRRPASRPSLAGMNIEWALAGGGVGLVAGLLLRGTVFQLSVASGEPLRASCERCGGPVGGRFAFRCQGCHRSLGRPLVLELLTAAVLGLLFWR